MQTVLMLFANEIPGHTEYDLHWRCILIAYGIILGLFGVLKHKLKYCSRQSMQNAGHDF